MLIVFVLMRKIRLAGVRKELASNEVCETFLPRSPTSEELLYDKNEKGTRKGSGFCQGRDFNGQSICRSNQNCRRIRARDARINARDYPQAHHLLLMAVAIRSRAPLQYKSRDILCCTTPVLTLRFLTATPGRQHQRLTPLGQHQLNPTTFA